MHSKRILIGWAVLVVATVAIILAVKGTGEPGLRMAIRATARLSTLAVICAVAGIRTREALIALPISHGAHYAVISALAIATTPINAHINAVSLPGGILIYALMVFAAVRQPRWALYVLWIIFVIAVAPRVRESWVYIPLVLMLFAALVVRLTPRRVESPTAT